ncbi:MAG: T9SS type A sorting domain-containing protein [Flavobacteriales bacterium]|nr:T9SS type A sorting domain-containing protein [Flavobacteriales bacterium]
MPWLIAILMVITSVVSAQKQGHNEPGTHPLDLKLAKALTPRTQFQLPLSEERIGDWLSQIAGTNQIPGTSLLMVERTESPAATHFQFQVQYHDVFIYRSLIYVNINKSGKVLSVYSNFQPWREIMPTTFPDKHLANVFLSKRFPNEEWQEVIANEQYMCLDDECRPVILVRALSTTYIYKEWLLDHSGEAIYEYDLNRYVRPPSDSTVQAKVFLPDPLSTSGKTYGGEYADNDDADHVALNGQRKDISVQVTLDIDTFRLIGPYVAITEFSIPASPPARSAVPVFDFNRSDNRFEDINAYYHVHTCQLYVQSLGFTNLRNGVTNIDTHALNGSDNSQFTPGNPPRLFFGDGGVDDAEDADVVIHEYGHALSQDASPNTNFGVERQSLDEANGDYLAASWSRNLVTFGWENVFSWDGHNEYWSGRTAVSNKHYPEDLKQNLYTDTDIWSATLMQIWGEAGREVTDRLLLQSMYSYFGNMTMHDAAVLYVQADSMLYNGSHYGVLYKYFTKRGLLPDTCNQVQSSGLWVDAGPEEILCPGKAIKLGANPTSGGLVADSVVWEPAVGLSCRECSNPVALTFSNITYTVSAYHSGCSVTDSVRMEVEDCERVTVLLNTEAFQLGKEGTILKWPIDDVATIVLYNAQGKKMGIWFSKSGEVSISSVHLPAGLYLIEVNLQDKKEVHKLIKIVPDR